MADPTRILLSTSRQEGEEVRGRRRAAEVEQGLTPRLELEMRDPQSGAAVDLEQYGPGGSSSSSSSAGAVDPVLVRIRALEALAAGTAAVPVEMVGQVVDGPNGVVGFDLSEEVTAVPQIGRVEVAVLNRTTSRILFLNRFYLYVNPSLFAAEIAAAGPPVVDQFRMKLRDSDRADNHLLQDREFDLAEICEAMVQAVETWNRLPPPISGGRRTTRNFPFLAPPVVSGVLASLYEMAARYYLRNDLEYAAAGVQVNDKRKADSYARISQQLMERFETWVTQEKTRRNNEGAFGNVGLYWGSPLW